MNRTITAVAIGAVVAAALTLTGCSSDNDSATPAATSSIPQGATNGTLSDRIDQDGHQLRNVDADTAPKIDIDTLDDPMGGWNLRVNTENFAWSPEHVSTEAVPGEGHAHVYINGKKAARMYGPWYYVNPAALKKGKNTVTVALTANDHTAYAIADVEIAESTTIDSSGEGDGHTGHSH